MTPPGRSLVVFVSFRRALVAMASLVSACATAPLAGAAQTPSVSDLDDDARLREALHRARLPSRGHDVVVAYRACTLADGDTRLHVLVAQERSKAGRDDQTPRRGRRWMVLVDAELRPLARVRDAGMVTACNGMRARLEVMGRCESLRRGVRCVAKPPDTGSVDVTVAWRRRSITGAFGL